MPFLRADMPHIPRDPSRSWNEQFVIRLRGREVEYVPGTWYQEEVRMWEKFLKSHPEVASDPYAQMLFDQSLFEYSDRNLQGVMTQEFDRYMRKFYRVDLRKDLDWEMYRHWYELGRKS